LNNNVNCYINNSSINTIGSWNGSNTGGAIIVSGNSNLFMQFSNIINYWDRGITANRNSKVVFTFGNILGIPNTALPAGNSNASIDLSESECILLLEENVIGDNFGGSSNGIICDRSKLIINNNRINSIRNNSVNGIFLIDSELITTGSYVVNPPTESSLYIYSLIQAQTRAIRANRSQIFATYLFCNLDPSEGQSNDTVVPLVITNITDYCIDLEASTFNGKVIITTGNGVNDNTNTIGGLIATNNSNIVLNGYSCCFHRENGVRLDKNCSILIDRELGQLLVPPNYVARLVIISNILFNINATNNCVLYIEDVPLARTALFPTATSVFLTNSKCKLENCNIEFDTLYGVNATNSYFETNENIVGHQDGAGTCLLLDNCVVKITNADQEQTASLLLGGSSPNNCEFVFDAKFSDIYLVGNMNITDFDKVGILLLNSTFRMDGINKDGFSSIQTSEGSTVAIQAIQNSTVILDTIVILMSGSATIGISLTESRLSFVAGTGNQITTELQSIQANDSSSVVLNNMTLSTNNVNIDQVSISNCSNIVVNGSTNVGNYRNTFNVFNNSQGHFNSINVSGNADTNSCILADNNSQITCVNSVINNFPQAGIRIRYGSSLYLQNTQLNGNGNGGIADFTNAGLSVLYSSKATLRNVTSPVNDNNDYGIIARFSSTITVDDATTVSGSTDNTFIGTEGATAYPILPVVGISDYASAPTENCSLTRFPA